MEETDNNAVHKSTKDFAVGSIVLEKFEVLEFIASGGKGRVYKVRDVVLDNTVALKVLIVDSKSEKALVRFQSEARTSSRLNHPNIATIFDFGLSDGTPYISMEFVDGETLEALCASMKKIPLPLFLEVFIQVCEALAHAHSHGIVHRDLKPDNIVVRTNADGTISAKILDFGVAKQIDFLVGEESRLTPTGEIVGTPLFMSPEQAGGQPVTPESDLYSLGCLMWFCLTGQPPLCGETAMETLMMHQNTSPPPLAVAFADLELPKQLCDCVDSLLSKDRKRRPSLDVVLTNLQTVQVMTESPSTSQPDSEQSTACDTINTQKKSSAWIAVSALVVVSIFVLIALFPRTNNTETPLSTKPTAEWKNEPDLYKDSEAAPEFLEQKQQEIKGAPKFMILFDCTDEEISTLKMDFVERIDLSNSLVTDKALEYLVKAKRLKDLRLARSQVTTLNGIEKLKNLEVLDLKETKINDASLDHVVALSHLKSLSLEKTDVTDAALPKIALLSQLENLNLCNTNVVGTNSSCLRGLKKLVFVALNGSKFSKQGIRELARVQALEIIDVGSVRPGLSAGDVILLKKEFPAIGFGEYGSQFQETISEAKTALGQGNKVKAMRLFNSVADFLRKRHGEDSVRLLAVYLDFFDSVFVTGDQKLATEVLNKAESIARRRQDKTDLLKVMDKQNLIALRNSDFKTVESMLMRTHRFAEQVLKPEDMEKRCTEAGNFCKTYFHFQRAMSFFQEALTIHKKKIGSDDDATACLLIQIGDCYRGIGDNRQARDHYNQGLAILERSKPENVITKTIFACAYAGLAQLDTDAKQYERCRESNDRAYGLAKDRRLEPSLIATIIQQRINLFHLTSRTGEIPALVQEYMILKKAHPEIPKVVN